MLTSTFEVRNKITGEIFEVCTIRTEELEFPVYNEDEEIIAYKSEQFIFFFLYSYIRKKWDWAISDFYEPVDEKYH